MAAGAADRGVMIVDGIGAASCSDTFTATMSRAHNDANVLTLGARVIGSGLAREIVRVWLAAEFEGGRHMRRVPKVLDFEARYLGPRR